MSSKKTTLRQLLKLNKKVDFIRFNFMDRKAAKHLELKRGSKTSKRKQLQMLQAYQRLLRVTGNRRSAVKLYRQEVHSALQIASMAEHQFVNGYSKAFKANGISSEEQASRAHRKAVAIKSNMVLKHQALVQHHSPHYNAMRVSNLKSLTDDVFKDAPSYEDLFGTLDFCSTPDCRSIFSPSAYFVDLMRLQAKFITVEDEAPLTLEDRRKDLFELLLSCENTNDSLPKIELVNEVLENALKDKNDAAPFNYEALEAINYPFNLPFNLHQTQVDAFLAQRDLSLWQVWDAIGIDTPPNTNAYFLNQAGLNAQQWEVVSSAADEESLQTLYGTKHLDELDQVAFFCQQTGLSVAALDLLLMQDLSDAEMDGTEDYRTQFYINVGDQPPIAYEDYEEKKVLENLIIEAKTGKGRRKKTTLVYNRLDRVNRFVRLAGYLNWSFADLDWLLYCTQLDIEDDLLPYLAWMQVQLKASPTLTVNALCGMLFTLKETGTANGPSFFASVFESEFVPTIDWSDTEWTIPGNEGTGTADENAGVQAALEAALGLTAQELVRIGQAIDPAGGVLPLTRENLALLYRYSQLPVITDLSVEAALVTAGWQNEDVLKGLASSSSIESMQAIIQLQRTAGELARYPFSTFEVEYFLSGSSSDPKIQNQIFGVEALENFEHEIDNTIEPALFTAAVVEQTLAPGIAVEALLSDDAPRLFLDELNTEVPETGTTILKKAPTVAEVKTILTSSYESGEKTQYLFPPGSKPSDPAVTEAATQLSDLFQPLEGEEIDKTLVAALLQQAQLWYHAVAVLNRTERAIVGQAALDTTALFQAEVFVLPNKSEQQMVGSLLENISGEYYEAQQQVFYQQLSGLLNADVEICERLAIFAGLTLSSVYQPKVQPVEKLQLMQRFASVIRTCELSAFEVIFVEEQLASLGLYQNDNDELNLSWIGLQNLYNFKQLIQHFGDSQNGFINFLQQAGTPEELAQLTQWPLEELEHFFVGSNAIATLNPHTATGLLTLQRIFAVAQDLNVSTVVLEEAFEALYTQSGAILATVAKALWGGLVGLFKEHPAVLSKVSGQIQEAKRDALVPYIIWQLNGGSDVSAEDSGAFRNARDLYNYFLIDVEVSSAVQTSKVLEAISSVQLYLYRSRNNLENKTKVEPELNRWWPWMESYRVWEANREIFLYPENYLQPELRTQLTPEFEALVNDLQQADLTDESNVSSALNSYLEDFKTIAGLSIESSAARTLDVDGYRAKDVCYLGRTSSSPISWKYRVVRCLELDPDSNNYEPAAWGMWREVTTKMKPVGVVNPVFAFNTWYLFWVETYNAQVPAATTENPNATKNEVRAKIMYCSLDSNGEWSAEQTLVDDLKYIYSDETSIQYYNTIYPTFFSSTQNIVIPYGRSNNFSLFELKQNSAIPTASTAISYITQKQLLQSPDVLNEARSGEGGTFTYAAEMGRNAISNGVSRSCSFWVKFNDSGDDVANLVDTLYLRKDTKEKKDEPEYFLSREEVGDSEFDQPKLKPDTWNHIAFNYNDALREVTDPEYTSAVIHNDQLVLAWVEKEKIKYCQYDPSTLAIKGSIKIIDKINDKYKKYSVTKNVVLHSLKASLLIIAWAGDFEEDNSTRQGIICAKLNLDEGELVTPTLYEKDADVSNNGIPLNRNYKIELCHNQFNCYLVFAHSTSVKLIFKNIMLWQDSESFLTNSSAKEYTTESNLFPGSSDNWTVTSYGSNLYLSCNSATSQDGPTVTGKVNISESSSNYSISGSISFEGTSFLPFASSYYPVKGGFMLMGYNEEKHLSFRHISIGSTEQLYVTDSINTKISTPSKQLELFYHGANLFALYGQQKLNITNIEDINSETNLIYVNGELYDNFEEASPLFGMVNIGEMQAPEDEDEDEDKTILLDGTITQFTCLDRPLTLKDVQLMYSNGIHDMPSFLDFTYDAFDGDKVIPAYEGDVNTFSVLGQPNWFNSSYEGQYFLNIPYQQSSSLKKKPITLQVHRLNSTAAQSLHMGMGVSQLSDLFSIANQELPEPEFELLEPNEDIIPKSQWPGADVVPEGAMNMVSGSMRTYFWDLFFQAPFLIAHNLQLQQQFEAAKKWYEYVFNPTVNQFEEQLKDENDNYWRFVGLRSYNNPALQDLPDTAGQIEDDLKDDTEDNPFGQFYEYHNDPFNPHAIANLRPVAYQKTMVMHYVQNLIDWGDRLFRQYTQESVREATMLYVLAYDLLGKQPDHLGPCPLPEVKDLQELIEVSEFKELSKLEEFLVAAENGTTLVHTGNAIDSPANYIADSYFGIPENERFSTYWNTVEERLFNIRHALNIEGIEQAMPLFEAPLDPMALASAVANGQTAAAFVGQLVGTTPNYRFEVMIQKAKDLTQQVISLGQSLLLALEKKDAETLALLLNVNEQHLLALNLESRQLAIDEANSSLDSLIENEASARMRQQHYASLMTVGRIAAEQTSLDLIKEAYVLQTSASAIQNISAVSYALPVIFGFANGGMNPGKAIEVGASAMEAVASNYHSRANISSMNAEFERRMQEWGLQEQMAAYDVEQFAAQVRAAETRLQMAEHELQIVEKNIDQLQKVEAFYKTKFTSSELYQWMVGKMSALFFQTYQLAADTALQAQIAWNFEKATEQSFIQTGYWDNLHQGLLAGESLMLDLNRMEMAFMKQNVRRLEIVKTISLKDLDETQLAALQAGETCTINLLSKHFDADYPGHYQRLIKSVSLSLPLLLGPYQNVHATLRQTSNKTLMAPDIQGAEHLLTGERNAEEQNDNIRSNVQLNQQVALSQGLNDNGMFMLNFDDQRYLPFEGTGAISTWELEMPKDENNNINATLTDVIIEVRYTALAGDKSFAQQVRSMLPK